MTMQVLNPGTQLATTSAAGLMSATDKAKLDAFACATGERCYPTYIRSSWTTSSDETTLPVTPCFVLSTGDGGLYYCDGN